MEDIIKLVKEIREEAKDQDNFGTRAPMYVVQMLEERATSEFNYDKKALYLDSESFGDSYEEAIEDLKENGYIDEDDDLDFVYDLDTLKDFLSEDKGYNAWICYSENYWRDMAYFFLLSEAKEYQKYQSHNLGHSRVYATSSGYANKGKLGKLLELINA